MHIFKSTTDQERFSISLCTIKKNNIENEQFFTIEGLDLRMCRELDHTKTKYPNAVFKGSSTALYNCHGMTFASRRTGIFADSEIKAILKDDNYLPIADEREVMVGDIVLYFEFDGISHSGFVVNVQVKDNDLPHIIVWSKWKFYKEVIHPLNECPYSKGSKKFYRLTHGFEIKS